jgi:PASTA domain
MHALRTFAFALAVAAAMAVPGTALAAPPQNDDLAGAAQLTGRIAFAEGTNAEATKELDEPDHAGNAGGASVWYHWTAPAAGETTVSTCGTELNTLLAVYTGDDFALLAEVAANDDSCGEQSRVTFQAAQGTTYRIAVDGFDGETGSIFLSLNLAPPNDAFADAQELTGDSGSVTGTTVGATTEDAEPDHAGDGWNSVWFAWTAPSSGSASFESCGSPFDTVLAVYAGSELSQLSTVAENDDTCGLGSRVEFQASAGTVYRIALAGFEGEMGEFTLAWNLSRPPPVIAVAPSNATRPSVTGQARPGGLLVSSPGTWLGTAPLLLEYQWQLCNAAGLACTNVSGQVGQVLRVPNQAAGRRIRIVVTATNSVGSASAASDPTPLVRSARARRCIVPNVRGRTMRAARAAIRRGRCRVGRIRRTFSNRARAGRVLAQTPRAGARRAAGARVHLVVSRGRRR